MNGYDTRCPICRAWIRPRIVEPPEALRGRSPGSWEREAQCSCGNAAERMKSHAERYRTFERCLEHCIEVHSPEELHRLSAASKVARGADRLTNRQSPESIRRSISMSRHHAVSALREAARRARLADDALWEVSS